MPRHEVPQGHAQHPGACCDSQRQPDPGPRSGPRSDAGPRSVEQACNLVANQLKSWADSYSDPNDFAQALAAAEGTISALNSPQITNPDMKQASSKVASALSDMVFAVAEKDAARLKDGLLRFSVGDVADVDHPQLLADLDSIIDEFGTAGLADLDIGAFVNALVSMARKNGIELPGTVMMLGRALVTLEGVVDGLLPGTSIVEIISRHVRSHTEPGEFARSEGKRLVRESVRATHGLLGAAAQANLAMGMLTRGQLRVNLDLPGTKDPVSDLAHAADRLTMGIIIAGLFIGSSVVYYARIQPVIFGIPVIGFVGYLIALIMGLQVVRQVMGESRRRR